MPGIFVLGVQISRESAWPWDSHHPGKVTESAQLPQVKQVDAGVVVTVAAAAAPSPAVVVVVVIDRVK